MNAGLKKHFLLQTPINITRNQASMEYRVGSCVKKYSIKMINSCLTWLLQCLNIYVRIFIENRFRLKEAKDEIACAY